MWETGHPWRFFGGGRDDSGGADAGNDVGDEWGETEGNIQAPTLEQDMLGLVGEEDDWVGRVGGPGEEEEGEE